MEIAAPRRIFPVLIIVLGALFALVPYWGDDVGLRESFLLAAVYITLASNLPQLTKSVVIAGPGASSLTVDGNSHQFEPFNIASGITVTIAPE